MSLIEHNPLERALRLFEDGGVLRAHEHVLEHGRVSHQQRRRCSAKGLTIEHLISQLIAQALRLLLWGQSVVEAEP